MRETANIKKKGYGVQYKSDISFLFYPSYVTKIMAAIKCEPRE